MPNVDKFVERMIYWCNIADLGYDQSNRQDFRDGGEADCSSLVIHALKEAGFDTGSTSYTGNMSSNLTARGWTRIANDGRPRKGDILLNDANHVGVWTGTGVAQASQDENNGIRGGKGGDQTGYETFVTNAYYNFPWNCYLRYNGDSKPELDKTQICYAVSTDPLGIEWCDNMYGLVDSGWSGDDYAGTGEPIYWIAIAGVEYQVETAESGWLDVVSSFNKGDLVHGAAGNENEIIYSLRVFDDSIKYRVCVEKDDGSQKWLPWMIGLRDTGGSKDDFAGNDYPIIKVQMMRV